MENKGIIVGLYLLLICSCFEESCKKEIVPTLTTTEITEITGTSSMSGGIIIDEGSGSIIARGVCWSTTPDPTILLNKTSNGAGTGTFTSFISDLNAATRYYVRAYATNKAGTGYGMSVSFSTLGHVPTSSTESATNITTTSCILNGTVNANWLSTGAGFEYGTTTNYGQYASAGYGEPIIGNIITNISAEIEGLTPNTTYHFRVMAINFLGTTYGLDATFITNQAFLPTVTTTTVTSITSTTALSGGNVTSDGGGSVTARGVCWSAIQNPTTADSRTSDGTDIGSFTSSLIGLTANTTYYVRAYATNSAGTAYGSQIDFTTAHNIVVPTLSTTAISGITQTTASGGGSISNDGGAEVTARGVCWSTTQNPTIADSHTSDGTGTGSFTSTLTGLTARTTYYVRSYATNVVGTGYGNLVSFATMNIDCIPDLLSPAEGEVLDNGCQDGSDEISWFFDWTDCEGATKYNLYVTFSHGLFTSIDMEVNNSEYYHTLKGYIADVNRLGWAWKVRAFFNGEWGEWSDERRFDVEPLNTDCPK